MNWAQARARWAQRIFRGRKSTAQEELEQIKEREEKIDQIQKEQGLSREEAEKLIK